MLSIITRLKDLILIGHWYSAVRHLCIKGW